MCEITALGVAIAAGCAEGIKVWDINHVSVVPNDSFHPSITENGKFFSLISKLFKNSFEFLRITLFIF